MPKFDILTKDLLHYVEITLNNESVRTEAGVARYWLGNVEMKNQMPTVAGMLKSAMTGNKIFRPVYAGTGKLMLAPRFHEFVAIQLNKERFVIERGAYWASDMGVDVDVHMNSMSAGMFSGDGFIQTAVQGTGTVIACSPGPLEVVDLRNNRLVLDGAFCVARSASLSFTVRQSSRSLFSTVSSGQGLVQVVEGTGRVYLSPVPNHSVALQEVIVDSLIGAVSAKKK